MNKKVTISPKPERNGAPVAADDWVKNRNTTPDEPEEKTSMKRLTIDVSADLHKRIKVQCALRGANIADVLRELLEENFPVKSA